METAGSNRKPEKQTAALSRYFRFNVVLTAFRLLELGLALFFLHRISTSVPFAVRLSCEYSFLLLGFVGRPLFVFVLCNAIVVALLAKPGRFCTHAQVDGGGGAIEELYEEIVRISENRARAALPLAREAEEVVYEDKEIITEVSTVDKARGGGAGLSYFEEEVAEEEDDFRGGLRPPEAEKRPRTARSSRDSRESSYVDDDGCSGGGGCGGGGGDGDDELSNEEFQRAIEAFIAKQLRFRREETLAVVLQSH